MKHVSPEGELLTLRYERIGPAEATRMLDRNTRNRKVSNPLVDQYARAMEDDAWYFLGDPIAFADTGLLMNGQHRLLAIEKSGQSEWEYVLEGLHEWKQDFEDVGRSRSTADGLRMAGIAYSTDAAACARLTLMWQGWRGGNPTFSPHRGLAIQYAKANKALVHMGLQLARDVRTGTRQKVQGKYAYGVATSALAAAFIRGREQANGDPFPIANFLTRLAQGTMLRAGTPVFALREAIRNSDGSSQIQDLNKIVTAWNAEQAGRPLSRIPPLRKGVSLAKFPDMEKPGIHQGELTELDEEVAEALQRLREGELNSV